MVKLLSIAGSDPSGGAGIQMDLKVFTALGAYGMAIPTSLTVQNTKGVIKVHPVDVETVTAQIKAVLEDIKVDGVKIGMLANPKLASPMAEIFKGSQLPIVVDPVLKSTSGKILTQADLEDMLPLLSVATFLTPNTKELRSLTQTDDIKEGIGILRKKGVKATIIVTGADESETIAKDFIAVGEKIISFEYQKLKIPQGTHGTGCAFSSALIYFWLSEKDAVQAYKKARAFVVSCLKEAVPVGSGLLPVQPETFSRNGLKLQVLQRLQSAYEKLKIIPNIHLLIPEVQSNLGEALPFPKIVKDVAAFPGRIVRVKNSIATLSPPEFGASSHVARIILTASRFDPSVRACMNIKYRDEWIEKLKGSFCVSYFSRKEEPEDIKSKEGNTLDWGTEVAIKRIGRVPDIIYDCGDVGKEPMIRVLGRDSLEVVEKIYAISKIFF